MKLQLIWSIHLQMCSHITLRFEKLRHILQNRFFPKNYSFTLLFSVFTYSSELVLVNEYVNGNQQHYVINKVRNYHDEVEKVVADFFASKLK